MRVHASYSIQMDVRWSVALISVPDFITWKIITRYPNRMVITLSAYTTLMLSTEYWAKHVKPRNPRTLLYQIAGKWIFIPQNVVSSCIISVKQTSASHVSTARRNMVDLWMVDQCFTNDQIAFDPQISPAPPAPRRYQSLRWHQRSRHLEMLRTLCKIGPP